MILEYADGLKRVFPSIIRNTALVLLVGLAIIFRSFMAPCRSILSIAMTLMFVYGGAVLLYQDGILNRLGFENFTDHLGGCTFGAAYGCFPILTGICLDYDTFLFSAISEYRMTGFDPRKAIQHGLISTGGTITAAGIIMAISFGSLMFSASISMVHIGFFL